jgi:general secretion pathway protein J
MSPEYFVDHAANSVEPFKWGFQRRRASPWVKGGVNTPPAKWLPLYFAAISGPPNRRRRGAPSITAAGGFTLIEVVLALSIFALMGAILYGAFSLSHTAVAKSDANSTRNQKQRVIADLLGSYIRSTFPYRDSPQDQSVFFDGESDSLTFVSAYSQAMGGRGMARISIVVDEATDGRAALKLEESAPVRLNSDADSSGQSHSVVMQENVREFRLAYLDPQAEEENWQERWDGREKRILPRAVRLSYLNDSGKEVRWTFPVMMSVLAQ